MLPDAVKRIVRLEVARYMRDRMTWAGLLVLALVLAAGAADYWNSLPPRPDGGRLFGEAYLAALALAFHASIAQDRLTRFDSFVISNFVRMRELYFGKTIAAVLFLLAIAGLAFVVALVAALGDIAYAGHYTALFLAGSLLMLPMVVLVELVVPTRHPVPLILALLFVLMAVYHRLGDLRRALNWVGLDGDLAVGATIARTIAALSLTGALYLVYRWRLGLVR